MFNLSTKTLAAIVLALAILAFFAYKKKKTNLNTVHSDLEPTPTQASSSLAPVPPSSKDPGGSVDKEAEPGTSWFHTRKGSAVASAAIVAVSVYFAYRYMYPSTTGGSSTSASASASPGAAASTAAAAAAGTKDFTKILTTPFQV